MIDVADLLRLAAAGPESLNRLGELGCRLKVLDEERAAILAELAVLGVAEAGMPIAATEPPPPARNEPLCQRCELPADEEVDGVWYCTTHGAEAVALHAKPV